MADLFFPARDKVAPSYSRHPLSGIIDIGSNSVRLVVYGGPPRVPATLFNEKVMAGLGRGLAETGAIDAKAMDAALTALARFHALAKAMGIERLRAVATAAVRDASNGPELVARAAALGIPVELLSGREEAAAAAFGVLSAIPEADGIVADLGGGSLELTRIRDGEVHERASFPLGVLRLAPLRAQGKAAFDRHVRAQLARAPWLADARDLPLYLVGGSWRSLARIDMALSAWPLPIVHEYCMKASAVGRLARAVEEMDRAKLRTISSITGSRIGTLGEAAALLQLLVRTLDSRGLIVSAFGLREGLLYGALSPAERKQDPLIAACHEEAQVQGRFPEHGDLLDRWIAPLFDDGPDARLRHAACLLGDVGWHANPEFRAERALETALHGNWVAIDARGRALTGQALFTAFGGGAEPRADFCKLASAADLARAVRWGLAIRLGQRLSGGVAGPLRASGLRIANGALLLRLSGDDRALYGEAVERRHKHLAASFGLAPELEG